MIRKRIASDFMTNEVVVASKNSTFDEVMEFFNRHGIQHLPVADGEVLIGILSIKDMLRFMDAGLRSGVASLAAMQASFRIEEVMTKGPVSVQKGAPQAEILEILAAGKFQAVPVLEGNQIRGIISNKDITRVYHYDATHIL